METEFNQSRSFHTEQRLRATAASEGDNVSVHRLFIVMAIVGIGIVVAAMVPALPQEASARDVLLRFCDLDAQGEQLTADGWQKVAALFTTPGTPRRERIMVARDFVVSPGSEQGRSTLGERMVGFHVEYTLLGLIDSSQARFSPIPPTVHVEPSLFVVRQSVRRSGKASRWVEESVEWRIEETVPEPHLGVDAALRYATELRANAREVVIRRNADKMLAALKRFR